MKKFQPDKLKPKLEKCVFIGYPKENVGYTFYHTSEGKTFVAKNGSFLEKEFILKEVSGRKVELDKVIVPSPELESISSLKLVQVMLTPISEEVNDDDHEASDQVTTEPRRSTRVCFAPEWYGNPILEVVLLDHDEPTNYEEVMMSPDSDNVATRPQTVESLCISVIPGSVMPTHTVLRRIYNRVAITHLLHR